MGEPSDVAMMTRDCTMRIFLSVQYLCPLSLYVCVSESLCSNFGVSVKNVHTRALSLFLHKKYKIISTKHKVN